MRGTPGLKEYDNLKDEEGIFVIPMTLFKDLAVPAKHDIIIDMKAISKEFLDLIETSIPK